MEKVKTEKGKSEKSKTETSKEQLKKSAEKSGSRERGDSGSRHGLDGSDEDDSVSPMIHRARKHLALVLNTMVSSSHYRYLPNVDEFRTLLKEFLTAHPISKDKALKYKSLTAFVAHGAVPQSRANLLIANDKVPDVDQSTLSPQPLAERPSPAHRSSIENSLFKEFSIRDIAEQLTLVDQQLIERIPPSELFNKNWEKSDISPFFKAVLKAVNNLSEWVQWWILSADHPDVRASRFGNLIDLAWVRDVLHRFGRFKFCF
jgi:hypothetical protein